MRAYDRVSLRRMAHDDTVRGLIETQDMSRPTQGPPGVPEFWGDFSEAFEEAARSMTRGAQLRGLLRLSRCPRLGVVRTFSCGKERPLIQSWCGSPYCPACANERAGAVARSLRDGWADERHVIVVDISTGAEGRVGLPSTEAVAAVRAAWVRVTQRVATETGLPRLEPLPRLVVQPDGVTQFVRLPALEEDGERALLLGVQRACRRIGLRGTSAEIVSTTKAIQRFGAAFGLEAKRFSEFVGSDLGRLRALDWRSTFQGDATREAAICAAARRWVEVAIDRQRQSRRQICLGSGDSLSRPKAESRETGASCTTHGRGCRPQRLRVRDWSRGGAIAWEGEVERLSVKPTRTRVAAFFDAIHAPRERRAG